jgi:serine protease inhibitor
MRKTAITTLLFIPIFLFNSSKLLAQQAADTTKEKLDKIFTLSEVKPSFKGGNKALNKYLIENIDTRDAQQGEEAYIYFIVSAKGNIYRVQVAYSNISVVSLEKSLVAAIEKSSGMWNTGMQNEHHITAYCKLKIIFRHKKMETKTEQ